MEYFQEQLSSEIERLKKLYEDMNREQYKLPKGTLVRKVRKDKTYFYHQFTEGTKDGKVRRFRIVNEANQGVIMQLMRQEFGKRSLPILHHNIEVLSKMGQRLWEYNPQSIWGEITEKHGSAYSRQLAATTVKLSDLYGGNLETAATWLKETAFQNNYRREGLKHISINGTPVRSKSELIIVNLLEQHGIAYQYELPIEINGILYRPDIVALRISDCKPIYWEHFGLLKERSYENKALNKLEVYRSAGITPWNNLIISYDSEEESVDGRILQKLIQMFLLA